MKIGIDIDGVLANFFDAYVSYHNKIHNTSFSIQDMQRYSLWKNRGWDLPESETQEEILSFYNDHAFENIPVVEGAREGILELSRRGHEMSLISARPDFLEEKTFVWVGRNFLDVFENIYFTNFLGTSNGNKSEVCFKSGHGTLIEDHLNYANECAEKDIKVFLLNQPYNQCDSLHSNIIRVNGWQDLTGYLI